VTKPSDLRVKAASVLLAKAALETRRAVLQSPEQRAHFDLKFVADDFEQGTAMKGDSNL
jgi:hypothetical protein